MNKSQKQQIEDQFNDLNQKYPGLELNFGGNGSVVSGPLDFCAKFENETINSVYTIEIDIPEDYPESPPSAKEIGGCIPSNFHKNPNDILCLSAPAIINMKFFKNATLIGFVEEIVIPYLYSFRYWEKKGIMPFGEYAHGNEGIIQSYKDLFQSSSDIVVLKLLKILVEDNYRGHEICPCGNGKKLRNCHGPILLEVKKGINKESFFYDFLIHLEFFRESEKKIPPGMFSKRIRKYAKEFFKGTED